MKKDRNLYLCILLCSVCAFLTFIWFILRGKGFFYLSEDFNQQQITFTMLLNRMIKEGGLDGWCWNLDLGTATIPGFSFYELGSPFFWITVPFPPAAVPYLLGWIYMLKYVVAGVTAYFYLRRFVENGEYAVLGALLYAFSGFQATNILFYHFHDVVAFFPLMLIGLERLMDEKGKSGLWIAAVALNAVMNYFFFVQEAVFLIIYFLCRYWTKDLKLLARRFLKTLLTALTGVLLAAFMLLPNLLYMLGSERGGAGMIFLDLDYVVWSARDFLFLIKGFLFPGESMADQSIVNNSYFTSTSCYLPLFGPAFAFAYAVYKKDWLSRLIRVLIIISAFPLLTAGFLLFTGLYHRWWFMLVLMMALATARAAEMSEELPLGRSLCITMGIVALFSACVYFLPLGGESIVYDVRRFAYYGSLAFLGPMAVFLMQKHGKKPVRLYLAGSCLFAVLSTFATIAIYQYGKYDIEGLRLGEKLQVIDEQYRYATDDNLLTMPGEAAGIGAFSSTTSNSLNELDTLLDFTPANRHFDKTYIPGLKELFAGKYHVSEEEQGNVCDTITTSEDIYYISDEPAAPIGFAVDRYIRREDLMSLDLWWRGIAMMQAVVIAPEDEDAVAGLLERVDPEMLDLNIDPAAYADSLDDRRVHEFHRDVRGFTCRTEMEDRSLYWFSVPFDPGWQAAIDGAASPVIDSAGMMLLDVPGGEHTVTFTYHTPGLRTGSIVSLITLAGTLLAAFAFRRRRAG